MKSEKRISTPVLVGGMGILLVAGLALWFGLRNQQPPADDSATIPAAQLDSAEAATALPVSPVSASRPPSRTESIGLPPVIPLALSNLLLAAENTIWSRDTLFQLQPRGRQTFGGVEFRMDGLLQLQSEASAANREAYRQRLVVPLTLTNLTASGAQVIDVGSNVGCLYLLGATRSSSEAAPGTTIAELIWRYADGEARRAPIDFAVHLRDWRRTRYEEPARLPYLGVKVVWRTADRSGWARTLRLYRLTLPNPMPEKPVKALEFVTTMAKPSLFFTALTLDPLKAGERPDNSPDLEEVDPPPGRILAIRVTDTLEQALPGVRVRAMSTQKDLDGTLQRLNQSLITDSAGNGRFQFADSELERLELDAMAETGNYSGRSVTWDAKIGDVIPEAYTIKLPAGVTIGGLVVDEAGSPIANARMEAVRFWSGGDSMQRKGEEPGFTSKSVITDAQGRWQMEGVTAGLLDHIMIRASHPDFIGTNFNVGTEAGLEQQLRTGTHKTVMKSGVGVLVRVTDENDHPISGATVWAGGRYSQSRQEKQTDATGRVSFLNIADGEVQFSAIAPGHRPEVKSATVKAGMPELVLKLAPGRKVFGIVQNQAGEPLPGARMSLESSSGGVAESYEFEMTTGPDGRFEWDGAPDEPQRFYVYKSGYEQKRGQRLEPDKENVVILKRSRQVQGWVLDADTEAPITRFRIGLGRTLSADQFYADYPGMQDYADANGKFTLTLNEEANSAIKAEADDYAEQVTTLPAAQDGVVEIVLRLKPSAAIRGVVVGPNGMPVEGATVGLTTGRRNTPGNLSFRNGRLEVNSRSRTVVTDAAGKFTLNSPPEGGIVVAAAPMGFAMVSVEQVRSTGLVLLQAYGGISGVFTVGGQPVADQEFMYSMPEGGISFDWNSYRVKTDEQGRFAFNQIPPGEGEIVRLIKTSPNSWQHSHNTPVSVESGKITQVTLGDSGALLVGRIRFESPPPEAEKLTLGGNLNSVMPAMPLNLATPAAAQAFMNSPERQAQLRAARHFGVAVAPDGTFTVDSIPPGTYTLSISASKPGNESFNSVTVASGSATITVPEGANPNAPIRLDEILLKPTPNRVGP